jgi:hypothetical protein
MQQEETPVPKKKSVGRPRLIPEGIVGAERARLYRLRYLERVRSGTSRTQLSQSTGQGD